MKQWNCELKTSSIPLQCHWKPNCQLIKVCHMWQKWNKPLSVSGFYNMHETLKKPLNFGLPSCYKRRGHIPHIQILVRTHNDKTPFHIKMIVWLRNPWQKSSCVCFLYVNLCQHCSFALNKVMFWWISVIFALMKLNRISVAGIMVVNKKGITSFLQKCISRKNLLARSFVVLLSWL